MKMEAQKCEVQENKDCFISFVRQMLAWHQAGSQVHFLVFVFELLLCTRFYIPIYANSPGLSGSLPDTDQIFHSPVWVTKSPGRQAKGA